MVGRRLHVDPLPAWLRPARAPRGSTPRVLPSFPGPPAEAKKTRGRYANEGSLTWLRGQPDERAPGRPRRADDVDPSGGDRYKGTVRLICFGDIHMALGSIARLAPALAAADVAVLTGDITNFGDPPDAARVVAAVRAHCPTVLAVTGNLDFV